MIEAQEGPGEEQDQGGTCQGIGIVCINQFLASVCNYNENLNKSLPQMMTYTASYRLYYSLILL
jgi:hypothetical protein